MSQGSLGIISTLIVDDEALARDELAFLLKDFAEIEVIDSASNGVEAVRMIEDLEPDLVFLDVQMPGLDGLGVISQLRNKFGGEKETERDALLPHFVLVTAYDHYAIEAFRVEALDYLLKPVDKERLAETVSRVRKQLDERPTEPESASVPVKASLQRNKILVRSNGKNMIVDSQDMVYATIEDGVITVVTTIYEGHSNYRTIEELQSNLDPHLFWRVHRSFLVNINKIKEVIPWFKSSFQLKMDDRKGTEIPVSRIQTKRLRAMLKI